MDNPNKKPEILSDNKKEESKENKLSDDNTKNQNSKKENITIIGDLYLYASKNEVEFMYIKNEGPDKPISQLQILDKNKNPITCKLLRTEKKGIEIINYFQNPEIKDEIVLVNTGMTIDRVMPDKTRKEFFPAVQYKNSNSNDNRVLITGSAPMFLPFVIASDSDAPFGNIQSGTPIEDSHPNTTTFNGKLDGKDYIISVELLEEGKKQKVTLKEGGKEATFISI